jgi:four helix bundle protein
MEGSLGKLDETHYWLELPEESHMVIAEKTNPIAQEANELIAIFTSIVKKVKSY